jgi:hypothetical protein
MYPMLFAVALLVLAASLGSWLFSQWLGDRQRGSALALGLGGIGFVLLLGAAAIAILSGASNWRALLPQLNDKDPKRGATAAVVAATFGTTEQWPATACIKPLHATNTAPRRWFLDNECERPVVVMLAWCDEAASVCTAGAPQAKWSYEPAGLVMTSMMARPIARRMPDRDEPISGTFALAEAPDGALRIRYLACYLSESAAGALLHDSMSTEDFQRVLRADECYSRVTSASQAGARSGQPPVISSP